MDIKKWLLRAYRAYRRQKAWQNVVRTMAVIVVFCTTYALILPAITIETDTICGLTPHVHKEECYETVVLTDCTLPESQGHSHSKECYTVIETKTCLLEEAEAHTHDDACYQLEAVCGQEETPDHIHAGTCFSAEKQTLVCGKEETEGHRHTEDCTSVREELSCGLEEHEAHSHTITALVCGFEEHRHDENCYPSKETEESTEGKPLPGDSHADVETTEDWEASFATLELTGDWSEDLIALAKTQLGYTESTRNYIYTDNDQQKGYTRYGQWAGDPYADWSASFVSFCLYYAEVDGIDPVQNCQLWQEALRAQEIFRKADAYVPVPGDLIFLDLDADEISDHVALVEAVDAAVLHLISGDWENRVDRHEISVDADTILGYAILPVEPEEHAADSGDSEEADAPEYISSGEGGTHVAVSLPKDTAVPENANLTVAAVTEKDEQYAAMEEQVRSLVEEDVTSLSLMDISFYDSEGAYLPVADTASVTIRMQDALTPGCVKVFHFVDNVPVEVDTVSVNSVVTASLDGPETQQTYLTFETEGFSVFAVVEVVPAYEKVDLTDLAQLEGNSFYIISNTQKYGMLASTNDWDAGIAKVAVTVPADLKTSALWTFSKQDDGTYLIHSGEKYLFMTTAGSSTAGLAHLKLVDETSATKFDVRIYDDNSGIGQVVISYTENNTTYHLNQYQGDGGPGFYGWSSSPEDGDTGSKNYLYRNKTETSTTIPVTNLNGKSFAIINPNKSVAMSATADLEDTAQKSALDALPVSIIQIDGTSYFTSNEEVPLWTFTAVANKPDVYYISTVVESEVKYLNMTTETSGALTLSTEKQELTVTLASDGKVLIGNGYTRLNSSGSDYEGDFWCWNGTDANCQMILCQQTPLDSSFAITYDDSRITVLLRDNNNNLLHASRVDYPMEQGAILQFDQIAPEIEGYMFYEAVYSDKEVAFVESNVENYDFRIYESAYTEGSSLYYSKNGEITITFVYRSTLLNYNLNRPTDRWFSNTAGWDRSDPTIGNTGSRTTATQNILVNAEGQALYSVNGRNLLNKFISFNTHLRETVSNYFNDCNTTLYNANNLTEDNYMPPGAEYVFQGWQATVDGTAYLFPEGAEITSAENGNIKIADSDGIVREVPLGTTLVGQWKQISNVVMFFVNHGDTMLENEDHQYVTNTGPSYFTDIVAFGHIYNPVEILPVENVNGESKRIILKSTHERIEKELVYSYDPANPATQVVVEAITYDGTSFTNTAVSNYNEASLEKAVGAFIRNDTNKTILLDDAELDKHTITMDNYKLYWYNQLLVPLEENPYHIDGVLVAKTQSMEIHKTFSGLTREQIVGVDGTETQSAEDGILDEMTFPLYLVHTENGTDIKDDYKTLQAKASQSGVYSYDGPSENSNIFKWTLHSVQGQRYAFEEDGYTLDGYDCSSLVSVHFKNGTVKYEYQRDATYEDKTVEGVTNAITDLYKNESGEVGLIGGQVKSVVFANFYTPNGTGMFSVSKVADADGKVRLPGAVFALYQADGTTLYDLNGDDQTDENDYVITNENGAAHFSNLPAGTYILKEISPPAGYQGITDSWDVVVTKDDFSGQVTVTIDEQKVYDNKNGGFQENGIYLIQNTPENKTVTINKYFETITTDELAELTDYCIEIQDAGGTVVKTLALSNATAITGSVNGYKWTTELVCGNSYTFVEKNYSHKNYLDTVVSALVNNTAQPVTKSENNTVASFSMVKSQTADTVEITNEYSNTFDLRIKKVDATNGNAPMSGVAFNIYGDFAFHNKPTNGADDYISYKAEDGKTKIAWYIATTTATDTAGLTLYQNMRLSSGSDTFLYVIDEANTPAGYVELDEPIVRIVRVNGNDGNYSNGVYTLTVENFKPSLATVTVTATKQWDIPKDAALDADQSVTLTLYKMVRNKADGSDRITDTITVLDTVTLNASTGWTKTWTGLPYAEGNVRNEYFIAEDPIAGFNLSYSTAVYNLMVGNSNVDAAKAEGYELKRSVVVTNQTGYELPSTGGVGEPAIVFLGLMLMLSGGWCWFAANKKSVRRRK